jgi:hypothetical protein
MNINNISKSKNAKGNRTGMKKRQSKCVWNGGRNEAGID